MILQICPYEVTRRYISDNAACLSLETRNKILGSCRARDFENLASISSSFDPALHGVEVFRVLRQVEAFFRKNEDFAVDEICQASAEASFERGERLCRITNRRLDYYYVHRDRLDPDMNLLISRAEAYIRRVLGPIDPFIAAIPQLCRLTSGATALTARSSSLPFQKLGRKVAVTPQCRPLLSSLLRYYGYSDKIMKTIAWNRVEFVPKSWKTHRTIACEPAGNVPFQLAFDTYVKRRLRRWRIDLRSQETNQEHARVGSIDGSFATVDLSMASDTVSYNTVAWLLPTQWFQYLDRVRSPLFRKDEVTRKYAKFSSMGNGATFALETLVFASFLHAVGSRSGVAYGDDLTIETPLYPKLLKLLKFFGFVPNLEKSFHTGPFRESCGHDYFSGSYVTPFYLRSTRSWDLPNACHNVNGLAKLSEYGELWAYLAKIVSVNKLPLTPERDDTLAGVFVHPYHAYGRGLIRKHGEDSQQLRSLTLFWKNKEVNCRDSRALAVWFLHRGEHQVSPFAIAPRGEIVDGYTGYQSSRYTTPVEKFSRRWQRWQPPAMGFSEALFGFSELITSHYAK